VYWKFLFNCTLIGYIDILLIPEGATNIAIREVQPSNNYLGEWSGTKIYISCAYTTYDPAISILISRLFILHLLENCLLAIRNTTGHYYLNGNWRIDFPRSLRFSGTTFHYARDPQGFAAPDTITALGPTNEPIYVVVCTLIDFPSSTRASGMLMLRLPN